MVVMDYYINDISISRFFATTEIALSKTKEVIEEFNPKCISIVNLKEDDGEYWRTYKDEIVVYPSGKQILTGTYVCLYDNGKMFAKGKVTEADDYGVVIREDNGNAIFISPSDVTEEHIKEVK